MTVAPIAGRHAIKTVSFGLEWQEPLSEDLLVLLKALHVRVRDKLPRVIEHQEIGLKIVVSPAAPASPAPENASLKPRLAGLNFEALQPDGEPAWALAIQRDFLAVSCHVYSRWDLIWPQARDLLAPFIPVLARECGIAVIGLQYVDQFRVIGQDEQFKAEDLFRKDSRYLPTHVFGLDDLWHSHHGFFQTMEEPTAHRQLNNIDVDVINAHQERLVQITTAHRALLDQPATDGAALLNDQGDGELHQHLDGLHRLNKTLLRELLTDSMCGQINLRETQ